MTVARVLLSLLVLLVLLVLAPLATLAAQQTTDEEKALRADFKKQMVSKDAGLRAGAVSTYDAGTRELPDGGASRLVARTLSGALSDDDMSVRQTAVAALSWGRDPETVIKELGDLLGDLRKILGKTATRPDAESRDLYRAALDVYRAGAPALARYSDDRSTKVLEDELRVLRPGGTLENISANLLTPLATALLELGSERAVETVIKATATFPAATFKGTSDREKSRLGMSRSLHEVLSAFAVSIERPPPVFSQNYQQDWSRWFKRHKKQFPKKLGKLKEAPGPPVAGRRPDRTPNRPRVGRPERP